MTNTYTQLYIHFIFAVNGRENLIKESFREDLEKVMCGIIKKHYCKPIAIYCNPDHTHIFIGLNANISPSKLMEQVKSGSSKWMNIKNAQQRKFSWQKGYGAFSYSKSQINAVAKYILNQPNHHKKNSFRDEYLLFLQKNEINYDIKYLFDFYY